MVLIIAILLAIAIPTFLGARNSANARAAQSNLRNALTAEQTYWTNNQSWDTTLSPSDAGSVVNTETSLKWVTAVPTGTGGGWTSNMVLVALDTNNNGVELTAIGKDNKCYTIDGLNQPGSGTAATGTSSATTGAPAGTYYYVAPVSNGTCTTPAGPTAAPAPGSASKAATATWSASF